MYMRDAAYLSCTNYADWINDIVNYKCQEVMKEAEKVDQGECGNVVVKDYFSTTANYCRTYQFCFRYNRNMARATL